MKLLSILAVLLFVFSVNLYADKKMDPGSGLRDRKAKAAKAKAQSVKIEGAFGLKLGAKYTGAATPGDDGACRINPPKPAGFDAYYITLDANKTITAIRAEKSLSDYMSRENEVKKMKYALAQKYGFDDNNFVRNDQKITVKNEDSKVIITYSTTAPSSSGSVDAAGL